MAGTISKDVLLAVFPRCPRDKVDVYHHHLNAEMVIKGIVTVPRMAAFLAQIGHESGDLRWLVEWNDGSNYAAYEGRKDLENTAPGDGARYCGRGVIQLTGKRNYRLAGEAAYKERKITAPPGDFISFPEVVAEPEYAFWVACWYWDVHRLNDFADVYDIDEITKRINGGYNGKEDRSRRYLHALNVLAEAESTSVGFIY